MFIRSCTFVLYISYEGTFSHRTQQSVFTSRTGILAPRRNVSRCASIASLSWRQDTSQKTGRWFCKFLWSQNSYVCLGTPAVYVKRAVRPDTLTTVLTYRTWLFPSLLETFRYFLVLQACAVSATACLAISACMKRAARLKTGE